MPIQPTPKIWMNGDLVDWDDAKIHVLTHTLHYMLKLLENMKVDKKSRGDQLRFVVLDGIARPSILTAPDPALLTAAFAELTPDRT